MISFEGEGLLSDVMKRGQMISFEGEGLYFLTS